MSTATSAPTSAPAGTARHATVPSRSPRVALGLLVRGRASQAVLVPVALFLLVRLVDVVFVVLASRHQIAMSPGSVEGAFIDQAKPADPGYWGVITNSDGQWYQAIATRGYPLDIAGASVDEAWRWAFPPVFPLLVHGVMVLTGLSFPVSATVVNLTAGSIAAVLLYALVERAGGRFLALGAVVLTSTFVSAPILQYTFSESLALLFVIGCLLALQRRRYGWVLALLLALAFTRLVTAPIGIVVVAHLWSRGREEGWRSVSWRDRTVLAGAAVTAVAGTLLWPVAGWALVGSAGLERVGDVTSHATSWFAASFAYLGVVGPLLVILVVALLVLIARSPVARGWGVELRAWSWAYPAFLLAVTPMCAGALRYLVLAAPTLGLVAIGSCRRLSEEATGRTRSGARPAFARPRAWQVVALCVVAAGGILGQWWYIQTIGVLKGAFLAL